MSRAEKIKSVHKAISKAKGEDRKGKTSATEATMNFEGRKARATSDKQISEVILCM